MKQLKLIIIGLCFTSATLAAPATFKICAKGSVITAKAKCAAGEKVLNLNSLLGKQGAPGTNGTFNPSQCVRRESTATGSGVVVATIPCLVNEVVITSGCYSTGSSIAVDTELRTGVNSQFPESYGIVRCTAIDVYSVGGTYTATAQAYCCRP